MGVIEVVLISLALGMDVFAICVAKGLSVKKLKTSRALVVGLYFGTVHFIMALTGYFLGTGFSIIIESISHWIAFTLLTLLGMKMMFDVIKPKKRPKKEKLDIKLMFPVIVATGVDLLAIGFTLSILGVNIGLAAVIIGTVTFALAMAGLKIGSYFGIKSFKRYVEITGGLILITMAIKTLFDYFW